MRRFPLILVLCLVAAFGVAACGGGDDGGGDTAATETTTETTDTTATEGAGGETIEVAADPGGDLKFVQDSLTAPAGKDTFEFTNESSTPHDFAVEQDGNDVGKTDVISGDTATVELDLKAGEYTFYCSVPGHRQGGMEGTLTVE